METVFESEDYRPALPTGLALPAECVLEFLPCSATQPSACLLSRRQGLGAERVGRRLPHGWGGVEQGGRAAVRNGAREVAAALGLEDRNCGYFRRGQGVGQPGGPSFLPGIVRRPATGKRRGRAATSFENAPLCP